MGLRVWSEFRENAARCWCVICIFRTFLGYVAQRWFMRCVFSWSWTILLMMQYLSSLWAKKSIKIAKLLKFSAHYKKMQYLEIDIYFTFVNKISVWWNVFFWIYNILYKKNMIFKNCDSLKLIWKLHCKIIKKLCKCDKMLNICSDFSEYRVLSRPRQNRWP